MKTGSIVAITRGVSPAMNRCELTHLSRTTIDVDLAHKQHECYSNLLEELGCRVIRLPYSADLADSVFVEDTAVVLDEIAVMTRPGAESRRAETIAVAAELQDFRPIAWVTAPGTLDGGDVLTLGRKLFVGLGGRSNSEGLKQLANHVGAFGYEIVGIPLSACLHLKSAVSRVGANTLLINPRWVDRDVFKGFEHIEVAPGEDGAANALVVGDTVIFPKAYVQTALRLQSRGLGVRQIDISEITKAEGAVTCCSILFRDDRAMR